MSDAQPPLRRDHIGASTFIDKGWSLIAACDYAGAEAALAQALALSPADDEATVLLGWAQMRGEKYAEALGHFQHVLSRQPQHALARASLGYLCLRTGKPDEAIAHLTTVIRANDDRRATMYAQFYLGLAHAVREQHDEAERAFLDAITLGPNLVEARLELGLSYWAAGHKDLARETWQKGVAANRFSPWGKRCAEMLAIVDAGGVPRR